jgi:hypothetical protein
VVKHARGDVTPSSGVANLAVRESGAIDAFPLQQARHAGPIASNLVMELPGRHRRGRSHVHDRVPRRGTCPERDSRGPPRARPRARRDRNDDRALCRSHRLPRGVLLGGVDALEGTWHRSRCRSGACWWPRRIHGQAAGGRCHRRMRRNCPHCGEKVPVQAVICPQCGKDLPAPSGQEPATPE